jgi:peptide/nickel transport system permease protein
MSVLPLDAADGVATEPVPPARRRGGLPRSLRRPGAVLSVVWLVFLIVASFTAPLWRPYDVATQDLAHRLALNY